MTRELLARYLALAIAALLPLSYFRFDLAGLPTNFIEVLVVLLLILTLISRRRLIVPNIGPIGLIVFGTVLASFFALDQRAAFGIVKGWFVMPILYYACLTTIFPPGQRVVFIKPALIGLVLVSLYALGQYFGLFPLLAHQLPEARQYLDQGRAVGFFESPNFLAMYLVPLTLLTGGYTILTKNYRACWWLVLSLAAILLSESQAGLLALAVGALWLWLGRPTGAGTPSRTHFIAVAILSRLPTRVVSMAIIGALAVTLVIWGWTDSSERWYIWQNGWLMIKQHPILGIGPGQFQANFLLFDDRSGQFARILPYALHPHNLWLNFYLSTGLLGISGFVWLLVNVDRKFFGQTFRSPLMLAASAGMAAILVHGLFDSTYFKNDLAIIFWLLVFLVWSEYKSNNENRT